MAAGISKKMKGSVHLFYAAATLGVIFCVGFLWKDTSDKVDHLSLYGDKHAAERDAFVNKMAEDIMSEYSPESVYRGSCLGDKGKNKNAESSPYDVLSCGTYGQCFEKGLRAAQPFRHGTNLNSPKQLDAFYENGTVYGTVEVERCPGKEQCTIAVQECLCTGGYVYDPIRMHQRVFDGMVFDATDNSSKAVFKPRPACVTLEESTFNKATYQNTSGVLFDKIVAFIRAEIFQHGDELTIDEHTIKSFYDDAKQQDFLKEIGAEGFKDSTALTNIFAAYAKTVENHQDIAFNKHLLMATLIIMLICLFYHTTIIMWIFKHDFGHNFIHGPVGRAVYSMLTFIAFFSILFLANGAWQTGMWTEYKTDLSKAGFSPSSAEGWESFDDDNTKIMTRLWLAVFFLCIITFAGHIPLHYDSATRLFSHADAAAIKELLSLTGDSSQAKGKAKYFQMKTTA
jgi:hypothetical protein